MLIQRTEEAAYGLVFVLRFMQAYTVATACTLTAYTKGPQNLEVARASKQAPKVVQIGDLGACWDHLVGIFWCTCKSSAIRSKPQVRRPTFRPSQEQKPFEVRVAREDSHSRSDPFRRFL